MIIVLCLKSSRLKPLKTINHCYFALLLMLKVVLFEMIWLCNLSTFRLPSLVLGLCNYNLCDVHDTNCHKGQPPKEGRRPPGQRQRQKNTAPN